MKRNHALGIFLGLLAILTLLGAEEKWRTRPFTTWSEGDAKKILNGSQWAKIGDLTSYRASARMSPSGKAGSAGGMAGGRGGDSSIGGENLQRNIPFRLIWYSLIPRQASTRIIQLQKNLSDEETTRLAEEDKPPGQWKFILITGATRGGGRGILEQLQETSLLIREDGEKLGASTVEPLRSGAINFYFPMEKDGKAFLTESMKEFRFETQIGDLMLGQKFKIQDCLVDGKLMP